MQGIGGVCRAGYCVCMVCVRMVLCVGVQRGKGAIEGHHQNQNVLQPCTDTASQLTFLFSSGQPLAVLQRLALE